MDEILSVWTGPGSQASANPTTFISEYHDFSVEKRKGMADRNKAFGKRSIEAR